MKISTNIAIVVNWLVLLIVVGCSHSIDNSNRVSEELFKTIGTDSSYVVKYDKKGNKIYEWSAGRSNMKSGAFPGTLYYFSLDSNGRATNKEVFNMDYRNEHFSVSIKNDTIQQNSLLEGRIYKSPSEKVNAFILEKGVTKQIFSQNESLLIYNKECNVLGVQNFEGYIEFEGESYPFTYQYVVIR